MKKLTLLTGLHKTGTTSIQKTCKKNLELLKAAGFQYPMLTTQLMTGFNTNIFPENHSKLTAYLFSSRPIKIAGRDKNERREETRDEFIKYIAGLENQDLLMVAEHCSTLPLEDLLDLKDWFTDHGFVIRVLCCIRKPSSWISSMVAQKTIGLHGPRITIKSAIDEFQSKNGLIIPRIQNITAAFPDTEFYSFDSAIRHKSGPPGYFFERLGINTDENIAFAKENEGGSNHGVRLNSLINQMLGYRYKSEKHGYFYENLPNKYPALFSIPGKKFSLLEEEVAPLLPIIIKENEWLKNQFGAGFYDEEINFKKEAVLLGPKTRQFLIENFKSADQPIKQIVDRYLSEY